MRAVSYDRLSRPTAALRDAEAAVAADPGDPNAVAVRDAVRDGIRDDAEDPEDALAAAEAALERSPNDLDLLLEQGEALRRLERYEEALPVLERALQLDRHSIPVLLSHAMTLVALDRVEEARPGVEHAHDLSPSWVTFACRGIVRTALGDEVGGQRNFARALEAAPEEAEAAQVLREVTLGALAATRARAAGGLRMERGPTG
jgi:tetratricopeptide (TPR) repeat protein